MSWSDYQRYKKDRKAPEEMMPFAARRNELDPEYIQSRKLLLRKNYFVEDSLFERVAPRLILTMAKRLVTKAPVILCNIRDRIAFGRPKEEDFRYPPIPELVFVPYFNAGSMSRFYKRPDLFALLLKFVRKRLWSQNELPKTVTVSGKELPMPDFSGLPPCKVPGSTIVAAYVGARFYWLTTRNVEDDLEDWLPECALAAETFPELEPIFFKNWGKAPSTNESGASS